MLLTLMVENLVIVQRAVLEPGVGLTVITGETGAGKSLLLDALDLVTGARARQGLVGRWGEAAQVTAAFQVSSVLAERLLALGVPPTEEGGCILRRRVHESGRSQAWINDVPVTLQSLRMAADVLVDLHAQHEPIRLADPKVQVGLLDAYGGHGALLASYRQAFERRTALRHDLQELRDGARGSAKELDYLRFQLREFDELIPRRGEVAELEERLARLRSLAGDRELAAQVVAALDGGDAPVVSRFQRWLRRLEASPHPRLQGAAEQLRGALGALEDVVATLRAVEEESFAPGSLEETEARLDQLQGLLHKHGPDEATMLSAWEHMTQRCALLGGLDQRLAELEDGLRTAEQEVQQVGQALAERRQAAYAKLETAAGAHLVDLGMPKVSLRLQTEPSDVTAWGTLRQEIQVCTNPGLPYGSIRDVASGGEAARLMLALSAAFAESDGIPVIVYDEVDSGVGGRLGAAIGAKLACLARGRTVLAVTHTPQLAASGSGHYRVAKEQGESQTTVVVTALAAAARQQEIADMLGGGEAAMRQAKALLREAAGLAGGAA